MGEIDIRPVMGDTEVRKPRGREAPQARRGGPLWTCSTGVRGMEIETRF